mgnify:CR=1 FL=1
MVGGRKEGVGCALALCTHYLTHHSSLITAAPARGSVCCLLSAVCCLLSAVGVLRGGAAAPARTRGGSRAAGQGEQSAVQQSRVQFSRAECSSAEQSAGEGRLARWLVGAL